MEYSDDEEVDDSDDDDLLNNSSSSNEIFTSTKKKATPLTSAATVAVQRRQLSCILFVKFTMHYPRPDFVFIPRPPTSMPSPLSDNGFYQAVVCGGQRDIRLAINNTQFNIPISLF